jgi:hypothetical protein
METEPDCDKYGEKFIELVMDDVYYDCHKCDYCHLVICDGCSLDWYIQFVSCWDCKVSWCWYEDVDQDSDEDAPNLAGINEDDTCPSIKWRKCPKCKMVALLYQL